MPAPGLVAAVDAAADRFGLSRQVLRALVDQESSWREDVISSAGAVGLTQVMPATGLEVAEELDRRGVLELPAGTGEGEIASMLLDPAFNATLGAAYLSKQLARFGDLRVALAAYNGGPGYMARKLAEHGSYDAAEPTLWTETRNYVRRILERLNGARDARAPSELPGGLVLLGGGAILAGALYLLSRR